MEAEFEFGLSWLQDHKVLLLGVSLCGLGSYGMDVLHSVLIISILMKEFDMMEATALGILTVFIIKRLSNMISILEPVILTFYLLSNLLPLLLVPLIDGATSTWLQSIHANILAEVSMTLDIDEEVVSISLLGLSYFSVFMLCRLFPLSTRILITSLSGSMLIYASMNGCNTLPAVYDATLGLQAYDSTVLLTSTLCLFFWHVVVMRERQRREGVVHDDDNIKGEPEVEDVIKAKEATRTSPPRGPRTNRITSPFPSKNSSAATASPAVNQPTSTTKSPYVPYEASSPASSHTQAYTRQYETTAQPYLKTSGRQFINIGNYNEEFDNLSLQEKIDHANRTKKTYTTYSGGEGRKEYLSPSGLRSLNSLHQTQRGSPFTTSSSICQKDSTDVKFWRSPTVQQKSSPSFINMQHNTMKYNELRSSPSSGLYPNLNNQTTRESHTITNKLDLSGLSIGSGTIDIESSSQLLQYPTFSRIHGETVTSKLSGLNIIDGQQVKIEPKSISGKGLVGNKRSIEEIDSDCELLDGLNNVDDDGRCAKKFKRLFPGGRNMCDDDNERIEMEIE